MKRIICVLLSLIILSGTALSASADGGDATLTALPRYYDENGLVAYDVYRIYVDLVPGFCGVFDELDCAELFAGAEFVSITDSDAEWREAHPDGDVFPDGYYVSSHVRRLTVELYEKGVKRYIFASADNSARIARAIEEFSAFDCVEKAYVVPSADFDPYGYSHRVDEEYLDRLEEMNSLYGSAYEDYVEYCKEYLDKYDIDKNGVIQSSDVFEADNAKQAALEAGEEYPGVEPLEIINFIVTAPGLPYDVIKDGAPQHNSMLTVRYIQRFEYIHKRDGGEYFGPTVEGHALNIALPYSGSDGSHLILGDVNGDDNVNARDVMLAIRRVVDSGAKLDEQAADVNCDGKVNSRDVVLIMKITVSGSIREQSVSRQLCRISGHKLTAEYAKETVHNAYGQSPFCRKNTYLIVSCCREGCDYIEKILVDSARIVSCHG